MSKQKIIGSALILVVFAVMVILGVRELPKERAPEVASEGPETEGLPAGTSAAEPFAEPSGEPGPEFAGEAATEAPEPIGEPGEPVGGPAGEPIFEPVEPTEPIGEPGEPVEPEGFVEDPLAGAVPIEPGEPVEPMTEPITEEPQIPSWQNPEEPTQSAPLKEGQVVEGAIAIGISAEGILPSSFEVKRGETVVLSVSSSDQWTHVFKFKDESLSGVAVGLSSGQTRVITFYAPDKAGDYEYYCDVPGHEGRGEIGKMVVE